MKKIFIGMFFVSQLVYGSPMPIKVEKACTTAEKSMLSVSFHSLAKLIDAANHDKVLGRILLALAAIGAGYLVTRPLVWMQDYAHNAERLAEIRALEVERQSFTKEITFLRASQSNQEKEAKRLQGILDYVRAKEQDLQEVDDYLSKKQQKMKDLVVHDPALEIGMLVQQCSHLLESNKKLACEFQCLKQSVQGKKREDDILLPLAVCLGLCDTQGRRLVKPDDANCIVRTFVESTYRLPAVAPSSTAPLESVTSKNLSRRFSDSLLLVHDDHESN